MTLKVALKHYTAYRFDKKVTIFPHILRLRPAPHCRLHIESYALNINLKKHVLHWQQDLFSNYLASVFFPEKSHELIIDVDLIVDMTIINPFDFFLEETAETFPFNYDEVLKDGLAPYLKVTEKGALLMQLLSSVDIGKQGTINFLIALNQMVLQQVEYQIRLQPNVQSCEETLQKKSGSCRDSALLLTQLLRHLGLASRFVSGYLIQLKAEKKVRGNQDGPKEDLSSLHAWIEVYIPGAGWIGLDPTSGMLAGEGHIPLACTPDPFSAAAITGTTEPCQVEFDYANSVQRI
ncbi:MAG: hypothetical protein COA71_03100 [SAR86 cluster bacterium]|uniref:Transglutaminase-like domain-containing protein n=1 Tax=SAR86 cluster bacterium TaxID=2030880 RepID=A0A2A5CF43_9GAMM|nr:MAG: hypothetical protein COA71_03100 [SAR86 cluster bacterium]